MTTFASFNASISGLTITTVGTSLDYTPESLGNADLPLSFPRLPSGDAAFAPADCNETEIARTIELVVCIIPAGLGDGEVKYNSTLAMLDYVQTAVSTWAYLPAQNGIAIQYSLATSGDTPIIVGDTAYHGVVATIIGQG